MKQKSYAELLKDPRWQKKRLEIMQRDNFTCQLCGSKEKHLNVHHLYYNGYKAPWEYTNDAMLTVCDECHKFEHDKLNKAAIDKVAKIGEVYRYDHSDYWNYEICYDIDYDRKMIYTTGLDIGSGYTSIWFSVFDLDRFSFMCNLQENFFDCYENEEENYFAKQLFYIFFGYATGWIDDIYPCNEEADSRNPKEVIRKNLFTILGNNPKLKELFAKAMNDKSFIELTD